jgi:hypothetical protein
MLQAALQEAARNAGIELALEDGAFYIAIEPAAAP